MKMAHSTKCSYVDRWDPTKSTCVPCTIKPGYEISPNCGYDDAGGRHEAPNKKCKDKTFNDGSSAYCQPCSSPPSLCKSVRPCNSTTDTRCLDTISDSSPCVFSSTFRGSTLKPNASVVPSVAPQRHVVWPVPFAIVISVVLVVICLCVIYIKRKKGRETLRSYSRGPSNSNAKFSSLSAPADNNDLEEVLSPNILSAPLQTVLDNLDVLEELMILLDPESHGVKNTKHLASYCSFTSTWITYTYSMKDNKSPLRAVLEGVTSRHPDWTVGHLAELLRKMERNDAIAILTKLRLNEMEV